HDDEGIGRSSPHLAGRFEHAVVLESVHARDADEPRTRPLDPGGDSPEAQIDDRRRMAAGEKSRGDVLEPQRLDAKKGAQAEAFVPRVGAEQEDVQAGRIVDSVQSVGYRSTRNGGKNAGRAARPP